MLATAYRSARAQPLTLALAAREQTASSGEASDGCDAHGSCPTPWRFIPSADQPCRTSLALAPCAGCYGRDTGTGLIARSQTTALNCALCVRCLRDCDVLDCIAAHRFLMDIIITGAVALNKVGCLDGDGLRAVRCLPQVNRVYALACRTVGGDVILIDGGRPLDTTQEVGKRRI